MPRQNRRGEFEMRNAEHCAEQTPEPWMAEAGLFVRQDAELRAMSGTWIYSRLKPLPPARPQGRGQDARVDRRDARQRRSEYDVEKAMQGFFNILLFYTGYGFGSRIDSR